MQVAAAHADLDQSLAVRIMLDRHFYLILLFDYN